MAARHEEITRSQDAYLAKAEEFAPVQMLKIMKGLGARLLQVEAEVLSYRQVATLGPFIGPRARVAWEAATLEQRRGVLSHLVDRVVVHRTRRRGPVPDCGSVELRWKSGGVVVGVAAEEDWLTMAVAVAGDRPEVAQQAAGRLGLGDVVDNPWGTFPGLVEAESV